MFYVKGNPPDFPNTADEEERLISFGYGFHF